MANNAENNEIVRSLIASLNEVDSYKEKVVCEEEQITVLQPGEPCSREISMIYTFNYQELPSIPKRQDSIFLPMQPKHGIFFVRCEGNACQVNFLIDEAYQSTNGSNAVISCLHRFFENYGLGETRVDLYCNNGSNNKNNCLLWYLAYNVAKKLHHSIDLHFLPKEQSKKIFDEYFADIKKAAKKTKGSIADLNSSIGESEDSNQSHIIDGRNEQMLDWQEHFRLHCQNLPKMRSMKHFRFNFENPGVVFYSKNVDNGEGEFRLFNQDSPMLTMEVPAIPLPDKHIDRKLWRYEGEFTVLEKLVEENQDVYSVEHNLDGRRYALKKVSLTKNAVPDEVLKEAKNLAKLEHVNVVRYHTAWLEDEAESKLPDAKLSPKLYIQMELCSETLHHKLKERNKKLVSVSQEERYDQVEKEADSILEQILQGVKYIHSKNIVHGDLKSHNILIKDDDDKTENTVKIGHFGLTGSLDKNTQREAHPDGAKNDKVFVKHDDMFQVGLRAFELYHPILGEENIPATRRHLVETNFKKFPDFQKKWPKLAKWISRLVSDGTEGRPSPSEILDDLFPSKNKIITTLEEEIREKDEQILVLQKKLSEQKI